MNYFSLPFGPTTIPAGERETFEIEYPGPPGRLQRVRFSTFAGQRVAVERFIVGPSLIVDRPVH